MLNTVKKTLRKDIKVQTVRKPTHFFLRVFSRHPSTAALRNKVLIKGVRVVYRHGSTTDGNFEHEINSVKSIETSSNKWKMKKCFDEAEVQHAHWIPLVDYKDKGKAFLDKIEFSKDKESWIIAKHVYGSRGTGNSLIKTKAELDSFINSKRGSEKNYILEEYRRYSVEYRLHVTEQGCFYTCRKMLKSNTPKEKRFQRHDDNCTWILETNPKFDKPANWGEIVKDCVKALKMIGADVLAFDVKCTSIKDSKDKKCKWILLESASAPSFGRVTLENYIKELPLIAARKYNL